MTQKIDKNARLCSKDIQRHIVTALDIIDSESIMIALSHNMIECIRLQSAISHLRPLVTNKRTCAIYDGTIT